MTETPMLGFQNVTPRRAHANPSSLPQTTATPTFNVLGGKVLIHEIIGECTTLCQTATNNAKWIANPTVGADVDLCATLDLTADAVGTMYRVNGDLSDAMETATSGAQEILGDYRPMLVAAGTLDLSCSASKTGAIKWTVIWSAVDPGARVEPV